MPDGSVPTPLPGVEFIAERDQPVPLYVNHFDVKGSSGGVLFMFGFRLYDGDELTIDMPVANLVVPEALFDKMIETFASMKARQDLLDGAPEP